MAKGHSKSFPHKNEVRVKGPKDAKFHGHVRGHEKGKPYSGPGHNKHVVDSTQN